VPFEGKNSSRRKHASKEESGKEEKETLTAGETKLAAKVRGLLGEAPLRRLFCWPLGIRE
jgi:hypothetical protein